jgi:hypothetical protein
MRPKEGKCRAGGYGFQQIPNGKIVYRNVEEADLETAGARRWKTRIECTERGERESERERGGEPWALYPTRFWVSAGSGNQKKTMPCQKQ